MVVALILAGRNPPGPPPPWWFFLLVFGGTWAFVSFSLSRTSGWTKLAEYYRAELPFGGNLIRFQAAQFRRSTNYNGCLNVGADPAGLYIVPMAIFRAFHQPLLIPWNEITAKPVKMWRYWNFVELRFQRVPDVPVKIKQPLAEKLVQGSGGRLQVDGVAGFAPSTVD